MGEVHLVDGSVVKIHDDAFNVRIQDGALWFLSEKGYAVQIFAEGEWSSFMGVVK